MQNPNGLDGVHGLTALKHVVLEHVSETEHVTLLIKGQFSLQFLALENLSKSNRVQNGAVQVTMFLRASVTFDKFSFAEKLFLTIISSLNDLVTRYDQTFRIKQVATFENSFPLSFSLDWKTCSRV